MPDSRPDSIRLANVGEDLEDWGGGGDGVEEGVDQRRCSGGGGWCWERIELLEASSSLRDFGRTEEEDHRSHVVYRFFLQDNHG